MSSLARVERARARVLPDVGARMYAFKVVETAGKFKDDAAGVWTPQEIADNWDAIVK